MNKKLYITCQTAKPGLVNVILLCNVMIGGEMVWVLYSLLAVQSSDRMIIYGFCKGQDVSLFGIVISAVMVK